MRRPAAAGAGLAAAAVGALLLRPGAPIRVEIPEGLTARQTAELLGASGAAPSPVLLRAFLKFSGRDRSLKPGAYLLRRRELPWVVARKLSLGLTVDARVVVPEGFMVRQIAQRLEAAGVAQAAEVMALAAAQGLEGRLFPSTYRFPKGFGAQRATGAMLQEFERQIGAAYARASPRPALTLEQALTVASIVEREAALPQERPLIAAVYLNRLKIRMPLQADPTVQYALGRWKKGLTREDLKVVSPYNTYARRGLPPGPICSPGLDSFRAVLSPADTAALYFVADAKGGHIFSESNEKHSAARRLYRKELRLQKERASGRPSDPSPAAR